MLLEPILNIDEVEEYKVSTYNRLGQLVYELEDYNQFGMEVIIYWRASSTGEIIYFMEFKTTMEITIIGKDISQLLGNYVFYFLCSGKQYIFKINL